MNQSNKIRWSAKEVADLLDCNPKAIPSLAKGPLKEAVLGTPSDHCTKWFDPRKIREQLDKPGWLDEITDTIYKWTESQKSKKLTGWLLAFSCVLIAVILAFLKDT